MKKHKTVPLLSSLNSWEVEQALDSFSITSYLIENPDAGLDDFFSARPDLEFTNIEKLEKIVSERFVNNSITAKLISLWTGENCEKIIDVLREFCIQKRIERPLLMPLLNDNNFFSQNDHITYRTDILSSVTTSEFIPSYKGRFSLSTQNNSGRSALIYLLLFSELYSELNEYYRGLDKEIVPFPTTNKIILQPFNEILKVLSGATICKKSCRGFIEKHLDQ